MRVTRTVYRWGLSLALWLFSIAPACALDLRVAIQTGVGEVTVGSSTPASVRDGNGRVLGQLEGMQAFAAILEGSKIAIDRWQASQLWIEPSDGGFVFIGNRWYRGRIKLSIADGGVAAVNTVDLEEYLYSVVGAEMSPSWPLEALKAQAVAARSYALYQRNTRGNSVYDVGDTTSWQVYNGMEKEASTTIAAVEATKDQVLAYDGKAIEAVFHSSAGGHTEDVENVWQEARPYLRGVPAYDSVAPDYQWTETFSQGELSDLIYGVGTVVQMSPARTSPHGRVITMTVSGDGGTRTIGGDELRSALNLRSTLFTVSSNGGTFTFSGGGFGHGVGMSQWGAYAMAGQGYSYQQILAHFYRNTTLSRLEFR
jgi:stage II sporulation protein D